MIVNSGVISNNEFENNKNESNTLFKNHSLDEIFQPVKTQNIFTMIIGDKKQFQQIHFPLKDIRIVRHKNIDEFKLKEKELKKKR